MTYPFKDSHGRSSELIEVEADEIVGETPLATCFLIDGEREWVPLSMIHDLEQGKTVTFRVPEWFAFQNELI